MSTDAATRVDLDEVVSLLDKAGFEAAAGTGFSLPTVVVVPTPKLLHYESIKLTEQLLFAGYEGFSVKTVSMHQRSIDPEDCSHIHVEFWRQPTLT